MIKTKLDMYYSKECDLSSFEKSVKEFTRSVAENFSMLIKGKRHRIKTRTREDEKQDGKLRTMSQLETFLYGICPKGFNEKAEEDIQQQLCSKVISFLQFLLEKSETFSEEYRQGSDAVLKMVGGYFLKALYTTSF